MMTMREPSVVPHFMDAADRRTHLERINPTEGASPAWCPGSSGVFYPPPIQTLNGLDIPIPGQVVAEAVVEQPAPVEEVPEVVEASDEEDTDA